MLTPLKRAELEALYQSLNPLQLQRDLEAALERLWRLADADPQRTVATTGLPLPSVTLTNELTETGG